MNAQRSPIWTCTLVAGLVTGAVAAGCNTPDPNFHVASASGVSKRHVMVSFLGVYRKGRVDPAAWPTVSRNLAAIFGPDCTPAFTPELQNTSPEWATWLDAQTRQDGATSDILTEVAPKAQGRFILVIHLDEPEPKRTPPQVAGASPGGNATSAPVAPAPTTPRRRGPRQTVLSAPPPPHVFSLGVSVYSRDQKDFVAEVLTDASSEKRSEAVEGFFERLHKLLPNARCVGWDWSKGATHPPATPDEAVPEPPPPAGSEMDPAQPPQQLPQN